MAEIRVRAGLSQSELARRTGLNKSSVSRIEAGKFNPSPSALVLLTTALDVDLLAITDRTAV